MKLIGRMQSLPIQTKLMVLIVVFLGVPFLMIGTLWYEISTESIERNAIKNNRELVAQISGRLEDYFADLEKATLPLVTNPLIQDFMNIDPDVPYELFDIRNKIQRQILPTLFFGREDVYGFSLVSPTEIIYFAVNDNPGYEPADIERRKAIYEAQRDTAGNRYSYAGIGEAARLTEPELVLTVVRKFTDTRTYSRPGLLIIDLEPDKIAGIARNLQTGTQGYIWIMDSRGDVVHHPDEALLGKGAAVSYRSEFDKFAGSGAYFKTVDGERRLIVFHRSDVNGWTMVSEIPLQELTGDLIYLRNATVWAGGGLILFVLLVLTGFSFSLTRSIRHLQRLMKKAENGDLLVRAPENRQDEIGWLNRSFNKMVAEIRMLIEVVHASRLREQEMELREREATMRALQSQINPHFLYNTLEVINSYAILEGVAPISRMATSLADVFRYSIGNPHEKVTLLHELEHVEAYFDILSERYPYLEVDNRTNAGEAAAVRAVRLVVQPLVENAFRHGYEKHKLRPGYIGIHGERADDYYILRIIDRGSGMDAAMTEEFNRYFTSELTGETGTRIGLWNVHRRIRLAFGVPYGLHIERSDGRGTIIQVRLPYEDGIR